MGSEYWTSPDFKWPECAILILNGPLRHIIFLQFKNLKLSGFWDIAENLTKNAQKPNQGVFEWSHDQAENHFENMPLDK